MPINVDFFLPGCLIPRAGPLGLRLRPSPTSRTGTPLPQCRAQLGGTAGRSDLQLRTRTGPRWSRARAAPSFRRHMSYDVVLFGSWCSKGRGGRQGSMPHPTPTPVVGLNVSALYNFGYKFRAGVSLDGVYDGSANIMSRRPDLHHPREMEFVRPSIDRQLAVGLSARAEFVMPYFNIGVGLGANFFHKGGDLRAFYQILTLKVASRAVVPPHRLLAARFPHAQLPDARRRLPLQQQIPAPLLRPRHGRRIWPSRAFALSFRAAGHEQVPSFRENGRRHDKKTETMEIRKPNSNARRSAYRRSRRTTCRTSPSSGGATSGSRRSSTCSPAVRGSPRSREHPERRGW